LNLASKRVRNPFMLSVRVVEELQVNLRNKETCKIINFPARKKLSSVYTT